MSQLPVFYFEILKKKQEVLHLEDLPSRSNLVAFQLCSLWSSEPWASHLFPESEAAIAEPPGDSTVAGQPQGPGEPECIRS